jgi:hypothetical protein
LFLFLCKFVFVVTKHFSFMVYSPPNHGSFFFVRLNDLTTLLPVSCLLFEMLFEIYPLPNTTLWTLIKCFLIVGSHLPISKQHLTYPAQVIRFLQTQ